VLKSIDGKLVNVINGERRPRQGRSCHPVEPSAE